jgi:hypothetical protein
LNKQYSKEEYFKLREKIIRHMKTTGEWGEFFPVASSVFPYNHSVAQDFFPLTKEEALTKGFKWKEDESSAKYDGPVYKAPEKIEDVTDEILDKILTCEVTNKNYRIIKPELEFYRKMRLPVPRLCPDERHRRRMIFRNPRKLWAQQCADCQSEIQTSYPPDRKEKIICEKCYLKIVN